MALSTKQRTMVEFIARFVRRHAYPPSVRDILKGGGISSTSVVAYNLNALERMGYIARDKDISRGIRLLKDVEGLPFAMPVLRVRRCWIPASRPRAHTRA